MEYGTVKFFNNRPDKLFGFIIPDDRSEQNIFFHFNNGKTVGPIIGSLLEPELLDGNVRIPMKGDRVVFRRQSSDKGPKAIHWADAQDWDRENDHDPLEDPSSRQTRLGSCPNCGKKMPLKPVEPDNLDPHLELREEECFVLKEHEVQSGRGYRRCNGTGEHPRYVDDDFYGDSEPREREAEDEEMRYD